MRRAAMGYAVLRLFYVIDKAEADGINSAHTSSTRGSRGVSPWHTTLLARYSVLYLPATGVWKWGSKVGQSALSHRLGMRVR